MDNVLIRLKYNPSNPRTIDKEMFEKLKKSLREFPQMLEKRPIVYDEDGIVLGGNMLLRAMQELIKEGVVFSDKCFLEAKGWNENQKREFIIKDNVPFGEWDDDALANEWSDLPLDEWGIDTSGWKSDEVVEDEPPEVSTEPAISKLGEVYQLGRHRLMCGDSTKIEDVEKLMNGQKADMVFTDPPYGVDYVSRVDKDRRKPWGGIVGDNLEGEHLKEFIYDSLGWLQMPKYICCNWQSYPDFFLALGKPNNVIVWDKGSIGLGAGYRQQHEFIAFYGTLDTNSESNVWNFKRDSTASYNHPTQKPVELSARAIGNSSKKEGTVLDLFGGSGSTLIACEQLNRTCYMMEIDPKYCDVIRKRYAKFIGKEDEWHTITPVIL